MYHVFNIVFVNTVFGAVHVLKTLGNELNSFHLTLELDTWKGRRFRKICFVVRLNNHQSVDRTVDWRATLDEVVLTASLQWRHNERDCVSNHQSHHCLLNGLFRRRSKKTSKLRVTGLCEGNSPVTGELPAQKASNAENISMWWRRHVIGPFQSRQA